MWFSVPSGYTCVVRNNDTTLYAYKNNSRDTFIPNGLSWQKSATQINQNVPTNAVCLSDGYAIPSSVSTPLILCAFVSVLCLFNIIIKMFFGVRR